MKLNRFLVMSAIAAVFTFSSCDKEKEEAAVSANAISETTLAQIKGLGFSTHNVQRLDDGYLIEGDIHMTDKELSQRSESPALRIGEEEQYRTYNLVSSPRTINIAMSTTLPYSYVAALDEAIARYNALNISLKFRRVSTGANIVITRAADNLGYLAYAGFPYNGQPYNRVVVNVSAFGSNPYRPYLASVLAHEIGHCIGFRHTDYFNRSYSCGGYYSNEGSGDIGAYHIPGTPSGFDSTSWMLACFGYNQNRPFNYNDRVALNYLY